MIYIIITYVSAVGSDFRNQQQYFWTLELSFKVFRVQLQNYLACVVLFVLEYKIEK